MNKGMESNRVPYQPGRDMVDDGNGESGRRNGVWVKGSGMGR